MLYILSVSHVFSSPNCNILSTHNYFPDQMISVHQLLPMQFGFKNFQQSTRPPLNAHWLDNILLELGYRDISITVYKRVLSTTLLEPEKAEVNRQFLSSCH